MRGHVLSLFYARIIVTVEIIAWAAASTAIVTWFPGTGRAPGTAARMWPVAGAAVLFAAVFARRLVVGVWFDDLSDAFFMRAALVAALFGHAALETAPGTIGLWARLGAYAVIPACLGAVLWGMVWRL